MQILAMMLFFPILRKFLGTIQVFYTSFVMAILGYAVLLILMFVNMSNLYLQNQDLKTISTALYTFTGPYGNQYNYICAGVIITIIPILILFLIFQKQVYGGMAAGAVKG